MTTPGLSPRQMAVLRRLVGDSTNWRARFDLLVFLGRYPEGMHSLRALSPRTRCSPREIQLGVQQLVSLGALQVCLNGPTQYFLFADDPDVRDAARAIGRLTPGERRRPLQELSRAADEDAGRGVSALSASAGARRYRPAGKGSHHRIDPGS